MYFFLWYDNRHHMQEGGDGLKETFYQVSHLPCRVALLSDLHNRPCEAVVTSLERNKPTLICVTGDFVYGGYPAEDGLIVKLQKNVLLFFKGCAAIAPTFVSLGNHEQLLCSEDLNKITATGVTMLENSFVSVPIGEEVVSIGGLSSGYFTGIQTLRQTDGGQWRIFNHGVFAPGQGLWPKYTKGIYENRLIVSAGLSNTAGIPRFFNPTEVVYIDPAPAFQV